MQYDRNKTHCKLLIYNELQHFEIIINQHVFMGQKSLYFVSLHYINRHKM